MRECEHCQLSAVVYLGGYYYCPQHWPMCDRTVVGFGGDQQCTNNAEAIDPEAGDRYRYLCRHHNMARFALGGKR